MRILQDFAPGTISDIRVIAIIGVPGIGKTTLAQSIFNDPEVVKTFDFRAWIYVPEEFDIRQITTSILDSLPMLSAPDQKSDISANECATNLKFTQRLIRQRVTGKRFLIMLDDVQDETSDASWDALCRSLQSAASGSTMVLTTRSNDIARWFNPIFPLELRKLSDDDCWSLIKVRALADPSAALDQSLEEIGRKLAAKCSGLPLAAKALGSLLGVTSDLRGWENVKNSRIWDLFPGETELLPALLLSCKFLPPRLRCVAYCSIFPKNYQFQKEKLLMLWMAEGLIDPPTSCNQVAGDSFYHLVARSFFQESCSDKHLFVMHHLIRELAICVMGEFGLMLGKHFMCCLRKASASHI